MRWLLNVIYVIVLLAASPWLAWAAWRKGKYREGFAEKFLGRVAPRTSLRPCVWLHAVSVGEVNLLGTLIDELRRRRPDLEFVISTTTQTGHAVARSRYAAEHTVIYCPLDFSWAVNKAMQRMRPELLVLAELELWPNLIAAARRHGARVAVVNGRMSEHSFRGYHRLRPLVRQLLGQLDCLAVQTPVYAERFLALGAPQSIVSITGSMKFDGAQPDRGNQTTESLKQLAGIARDDIVLLAGSTQSPEEQMAFDAYRQLTVSHPRLRLILVPRHPDRFDEVAQMLDGAGIAWQRRTKLHSSGSDSGSRVLLVDRMGELGAWWGAAQIAFVGGTFGDREGQNMIEPAAYGAAVCFGPRTRNFRDVVALLLDRKAAVVVSDASELKTFVQRCLEQPEYAAELGQNARQAVAEQLGATRRTVELLLPLLGTAANAADRDAA